MQTRRELYELIGYHDYEALDEQHRPERPPRRAPRQPPSGAWRSIEVRVHPAAVAPAAGGPARLEARRVRRVGGRRGRGCRCRRDGRLPRRRQRRGGPRRDRRGRPWPPRAPWRWPIRAPTGPRSSGSRPTTAVHAEWAAWANGTAARELDFHDTFLAADYAHPADSIPPLDRRRPAEGRRTARASSPPSPPRTRSTSSLVKGISLHAQKKDHVGAPGAGDRRRARRAPGPRDDRRLPRDQPGGAPRPSRRASRGRARSPPGRPPPRRGPGSSPSRPWTARCGARARRTPSTRARTA